MIFPPADPLDDLLADFLADGAPRQQMFRSVNLRRLRQDGRAAVAHQQIDGRAQRRIRGDAGIAVRAAALQREDQLARRDRLALHGVRLGQDLFQESDGTINGLRNTALVLDRHRDELRPFLEALRIHQPGNLVGLAAEPQHHDRRHVGMPRVTRERAAQHVHLEARRGHAATAPVGQRNDAVDVREFFEQRREARRDHPTGRRRAVHRRHDADVVARRGAAVGPAIALEGGRRHDEVGGMGVGTEGIVALEVAHDAVVRVDVRAGRKIFRREADDLVVLAQRLPLLHRPGEDLVTGRHTRRGRDLTLDLGSGQDVHARHDDVVGGVQANGERGRHCCFLLGRRPGATVPRATFLGRP